MKKIQTNIFFLINQLNEKISFMEKTIVHLEQKIDLLTSVHRNHLTRVKNGEELSDDAVYYGSPYNDLSPYKAYKSYKNKDFNFLFIDVSSDDYQSPVNFTEAVKIQLSELEVKAEIYLNKKTPIFIISEDGTKSILACEKLVSMGYYNTNNISGGYKFWPGARQQQPSVEQSA